MDWTLHPATYICPEHGVDLSEEVRREALSKGTTVIRDGGNQGLGSPAPTGTSWRNHSPAGPFLVVVTCPGKPAKEGEEPKAHEQPFEGIVK